MFQSLYDGFLTSMLTIVGDVTAQMSGALATPLAAAATIYIIGYGIAILRGSADGNGVDFAIQVLKLAIIYSLVTNAGAYTTWVSSVVLTGIPDFVSRLTSSTSGGLPSDGILSKAGFIAEKIKTEYGSFDLSGQLYAMFMGGMVYIVAALVAAVAFALTLLAQFGLALMAALGPLFVAFALYDFSRGWFFSWLSQILNFAILQLLVTLLAIFATTFVAEVYTAAGAVETGRAVVFMIVGLLVVVIFFFLLPSIAASLVGGAQASTGVVQRATERAIFRGRKGGSGGGSASGGVNRIS